MSRLVHYSLWLFQLTAMINMRNMPFFSYVILSPKLIHSLINGSNEVILPTFLRLIPQSLHLFNIPPWIFSSLLENPRIHICQFFLSQFQKNSQLFWRAIFPYHPWNFALNQINMVRLAVQICLSFWQHMKSIFKFLLLPSPFILFLLPDLFSCELLLPSIPHNIFLQPFEWHFWIVRKLTATKPEDIDVWQRKMVDKRVT